MAEYHRSRNMWILIEYILWKNLGLDQVFQSALIYQGDLGLSLKKVIQVV